MDQKLITGIFIIVVLAVVVRLAYPVWRDCGWKAGLRGYEWVWLMGGCEK